MLEEQVAEVQRLKIEVVALQEKLGQNSRNSSLPSLSDAPKHPRHSQREPSVKKQGALLGHHGHGCKLKTIEVVHTENPIPTQAVLERSM